MIVKSLYKIVFYIHKLLVWIFPPSDKIPRAGNIYVEILGLLGLLLYLSNINLNSDLFSTGEILLGVSFLLAWKHLRILLHQPLFWLMLLWIAAVAASAISGIIKFPFVDKLDQLDEARKMALYALLIPIGWWIGPNVASIRNALLITCLGFVIAALPWVLDWSTLISMFEGSRPDRNILGFGAIQYATWAGLLLLAIAFLGKELLPEYLKHQKKLIFGYTILILFSLFLAVGIYITLSRMVWIAIVISFSFGIISYMITIPGKKKFSFYSPLTALIIFSMLIVLGINQLDRISERFLSERHTIDMVIKGEWDEIEITPIGKRIHLYRWAITQSDFVTIFGWGPVASEVISHHEDLRERYNWPPDQYHPHLHNDLLEILFRTGILGALTMSLTLVLFIKGVTSSFRLGNIPHPLFIFFLAGIFFIVLTGLTNFSLRIQALIPVFGGVMFASILSYRSNIIELMKTKSV